jgi:hypothetical protein
MELTDLGSVSLAFQVVILFLLIIGLPFVKGKDNKNNAKRHGYSTLLALILHSILVFGVMVPSFSASMDALASFSPVESVIIWSHIILGTIAEIGAIGLVAFWLFRFPYRMMCYKTKAWMTPVFIIWAVSLINGALLHILGIM